uniref:Transthyretin-like family protein n=2 Tax=Parascaris univalens TaxID=6257 RepID=A0A915B9G5_PARUN
ELIYLPNRSASERACIFLLGMLFEILLTTLLMIDMTDSFLGNTQNIIVSGMVGCGNRAQNNAVIELREYDRFPDSDDVLARTKTGRRGKFKLTGRHKEMMGIEPYLRIKHHCVNGYNRKECNASFEYPIPKKYVGGHYFMGIINLSIVTEKHSIKCLEDGKKVSF